MGFNQSRLAPLCHSAHQLRHHHQVNCFCWSTAIACGTSATALLGPLFLISRVPVPHGRLLHRLRPILWAKDKVQLPRLSCRSQQKIEIDCHVRDICSRNNTSCIKAKTKYVAYTSPGWEHNRLHLGTSNDTVGITIIRLCSQSSTDGGGWHKAHPTAGVLLGAQHSSINANPGSRRLTNKVWADSSNLSALVRFGGTILSIVKLGLIN